MTEQESILKIAVKAFIASLEDTFTVSFFSKKDDCIVTRNGQKDGPLAGGEDKLANAPVVAYYDRDKDGWRSFNVNNLVEIRCGDKVFKGAYS